MGALRSEFVRLVGRIGFPSFGRGFDSHRPLQKFAKFTFDSAALTHQPSLDLRSKGWGFAPKLRPNFGYIDALVVFHIALPGGSQVKMESF